MIRFYAYYSCGGYKDMYLGNDEAPIEPSYFLPLLPVMKKRNLPNELEKISQLEKLRRIEIINSDNSYGFPQEANIMFSHGAYRSIYRTLKNGQACLSVRELANSIKDEEGRNIPFTFLVTAEGASSISRLDDVATDFKNNYTTWLKFLSNLFSYDPYVNGIQFDIPSILAKINGVNKGERFSHEKGKVEYLIIDNSSYLNICLKEQALNTRDIKCVLDSQAKIISLPTPATEQAVGTTPIIPKNEGGTSNDSPPVKRKVSHLSAPLEKLRTKTASDNEHAEKQSNRKQPATKSEIKTSPSLPPPNNTQSVEKISINELTQKLTGIEERLMEIQVSLNELKNKTHQLTSEEQQESTPLKIISTRKDFLLFFLLILILLFTII